MSFTTSVCYISPTVQPELRIVLIGRVEAGKTAVMNTILRCSDENEKDASQTRIACSSGTETSQKEEVRIAKQKIVIVDTPGLCHADKSDEEVIVEIKKGVSLADPGPHVFLFVLDLEVFTQECQDMVEMIWKTFGENAGVYTMALFTHGNELNERGQTIEAFTHQSTELKDFLSKCQGGSYAIDNNDQNPSHATELLQRINDMVNNNEGKHYIYTEEMKEAGERESRIRGKIARSVNGAALAGAGVGGVTTYFAGSTIGVPVGVAAGAAVGGVMGGVGIVAWQYIKPEKCVIQ